MFLRFRSGIRTHDQSHQAVADNALGLTAPGIGNYPIIWRPIIKVAETFSQIEL